MEPAHDYYEAKPETMPSPTYWPFMLAVSLAFIGWGLLSSAIIFFGGLGGMFISIAMWIKDMLLESNHTDGKQEKVSD